MSEADRKRPGPLEKRTRSYRLLYAWTESPLYPASAVILLLLFWQFVVAPGHIPGLATKYLSSPLGVAESLIDILNRGYDGHSLFDHVWASLRRSLQGFLLGSALAIPLGLVMGYYRLVGNLLIPIFSFLRPIPAISFIPVVIIWFGIGEVAKVLVIFWTSFIYVVLGASLGVRATPRDFLRVAANYNLSGARTLFSIVLPAALPQIVVSLRTGMALSWAVVITAELIAAREGLGYLIFDASQLFRIQVVFVGLLLIGTVGVLMELGFRYVERRILHWQGR